MSLSVLIVLGMLSSCSDDEKTTSYGSGMRITIQQESFGAVTRAAATGSIHQETYDLGDGIFMDVTLQEDFADAAQPITRSGLTDGRYTILGYYTDGRFAGSNVGMVSGSTFVPVDDFKFHDGTYDFICVSNVDITPNNDIAIVQRGQAKERVALISDKVRGEIKGEDVELTFTMRHKESGIRFCLNSSGGFDGVKAVIATEKPTTEKPAIHHWALPALSSTLVESSPLGNIEIDIANNVLQVESEYEYFLPGTDATDITLTFTDGSVWGRDLKGRSIMLTDITNSLVANTRYTATITFRDAMPAFEGIIAIGSDGKLTLTAESDKDFGARMVFFKGGSVVASGSRYADWSTEQVVYNPAGTNFANWVSIPFAPGGVNIDADYHTYKNVMEGRGDPCRLVGLDVITESNFDNSLWRLPTKGEYEKAAIEQWLTSETSNYVGNGGVVYAGYPITINGAEIFHPAVGVRNSSGKLENSTISSRYWSATSTGPTNISNLAISSSTNKLKGTNPGGGAYPVRCVPQEKKVVPGIGADYPIPAFNHIIAIGSDGKLTVTAEDNDKDARLVYFKFGSVIALSCANEWSSKEVAYNPSKLSLDDLNTWDGVPYLKGSTEVGSVSHNAQTVSEGMGDPCRLVGLTDDDISSGKVDNGEWRLPTKDEHKDVTASSVSNGLDEHRDYKGRYITLSNKDFPSPVFYPIVSTRIASGIDSVESVFYLSSTSYWQTCSTLFFNSGTILDNMLPSFLNHGFTVRCVPQKLILS